MCSAKDHAEQSHAEQLADLPTEMLAVLDKEMKQTPQMELSQVLRFSFADKMLEMLDYSQEVVTISHMFNDTDADSNGQGGEEAQAEITLNGGMPILTLSGKFITADS